MAAPRPRAGRERIRHACRLRGGGARHPDFGDAAGNAGNPGQCQGGVRGLFHRRASFHGRGLPGAVAQPLHPTTLALFRRGADILCRGDDRGLLAGADRGDPRPDHGRGCHALRLLQCLCAGLYRAGRAWPERDPAHVLQRGGLDDRTRGRRLPDGVVAPGTVPDFRRGNPGASGNLPLPAARQWQADPEGQATCHKSSGLPWPLRRAASACGGLALCGDPVLWLVGLRGLPAHLRGQRGPQRPVGRHHAVDL